MKFIPVTSMAAAMLVAAQPAFAANLEGSVPAVHRSAGFAGINVTLNGHKGALKPSARLALSMNHLSYQGWTAASAAVRSTSVELGLSKLGRANFYVAGQKMSGLDKRLGLAPLATAMLVIGGVAVGGAAVIAMNDPSKHNGLPRDPKTGCPLGVQVCTQ